MLFLTLLLGAVILFLAPLVLLWRLAHAMRRRRLAGGAVADLLAEVAAIRDQATLLRRDLARLEAAADGREATDA